MDFKKTLLATTLVSMATLPGLAQAATSAGNGSLGGQVSLTNSDSGEVETDSYTAIASASYFFTDGLEAGMRVTYNETETDGPGNQSSGGDAFVLLSPSVQYNFLTDSDIVPFIGASYDYSGAGDFDDTDFYSIYGGSRFFLAENTALRLEYRYQEAVDDDDFDGEITTFTIGVEWFF